MPDDGTQLHYATGWPKALQSAVTAAAVVVVAVEVLDSVAYAWRRMARRTSGWWDAVEHRERSQVRRAELGYLLRRSRAR